MSIVGVPGYQETAAGWIPTDWSALPLGAIASVRKDRGVAKQGVRCVELEHVEPETGRLLGWDSSGVQASIKTTFKRGDVLFGKLRPYLRKYAIAPFDGICSTEILAIHDRDGQSDNRFLFHLMQGDGVFATVKALSYGTKMPRVSWTDLSDIVLGIPPLPEQQEIATILSAADDKLAVIARQIEATQTLKRGLMQTLFSRGVGTQDADGRWVPHAEFKDSEQGRIPQTWRVCQLQDISEFITKGGTPTTYGFDWVRPEDGIPFFRSECVTDQGFNSKGMNFIAHEAHRQMERSEVRPGDVLMTITGNIGRVAKAPTDYATANINQHIARVRVNDGDTEYVYQCLKQDFYAKYYGAILTGQAYPQISLKQVRETPIVLAPLLEQKHIARVLADADVKTALLGRKLGAFQTLKRGLMQKLLTGEWRVSVDTSATGT